MSALHSLGTLSSTHGTFRTRRKELGAAVLIDTAVQLHSARQAVPGQDFTGAIEVCFIRSSTS